MDEKSILFCLWLRELEILDSINVQLQNWSQLLVELVDMAAEHNRPTTNPPKLFFPDSFFCFSRCGRPWELRGPCSCPGADPALIDYPNVSFEGPAVPGQALLSYCTALGRRVLVTAANKSAVLYGARRSLFSEF